MGTRKAELFVTPPSFRAPPFLTGVPFVLVAANRAANGSTLGGDACPDANSSDKEKKSQSTNAKYIQKDKILPQSPSSSLTSIKSPPQSSLSSSSLNSNPPGIDELSDADL